MKRFMQDLGDLTGLDIVAAAHCASVRGKADDSDAAPAGGTLARSALRWLGLVPSDDGRCRTGGPSRADAIPPPPRLH